jgi:hypothetical protein
VAEAYRIRILDGGDVLRVWTATGPAAIYTAAQMASDFPAGGTGGIEVTQLGADGEPGAPAAIAVTIPG